MYIVIAQEAYESLKDHSIGNKYKNLVSFISKCKEEEQDFVVIGDDVFDGVDKVIGFNTEDEARSFVKVVRQIFIDYNVPIARIIDRLVEREQFFLKQEA